jgi:hypothetical protein
MVDGERPADEETKMARMILDEQGKPVTEMAYGKEYPVWETRLSFSCGHTSVGTIATSKGKDHDFDTPCSRCYKGPFGNVWD